MAPDSQRAVKKADAIFARTKYIPARTKTRDQHTVGHINCPACAERTNLLTAVDADISSLPFAEASERWMDIRKHRSLKPRGHERMQEYLNALSAFFGKLRLCDVRAGHLREYQLARLENFLLIDGIATQLWTRAASNSTVNHELNALSQLLSHCGLWAALVPYYHPLRVPRWSPREVLTEEDEERLFEIAKKHPEVELAYCIAAMTNNTSAAGCELRGLRLRHLSLQDPTFDREGNNLTPSTIYVPPEATKRESRPRRIPLNPAANWAARKLYDRALRLGATDPDHYLLPFRKKKNEYDPKRQASRWYLRNNWNKLRELTGLVDLCPHDLRHQCITRLFENGASKETVKAIAGHVTDEMADYYSHIRVQAKLAALNSVSHLGSQRKPVAAVRSGGRRVSSW